MKKIAKQVEIHIKEPTRFYDDSDDLLISADINVWKQANKLLRRFIYTAGTEYEENIEVDCELDFKPICRNLLTKSKGLKSNSHPWTYSKHATVINAVLKRKDGDQIDDELAKNVAIRCISDVFMIMNLSLPGSCNLEHVSIGKDSKDSHLSISSTVFGDIYDVTKPDELFPIAALDLGLVKEWYYLIGIDKALRANSKIQTSILSFMHLLRSENDITSIVWIFHALEALYSTKVGEGFTGLTERIAIFHGLDSTSKKHLKKTLRGIYDMRSSFVHGGYKVENPITNAYWEEESEKEFLTIMDYKMTAFSILTSTYQKMIANNWTSFSFEEKLITSRAQNA